MQISTHFRGKYQNKIAVQPGLVKNDDSLVDTAWDGVFIRSLAEMEEIQSRQSRRWAALSEREGGRSDLSLAALW